MSDSYLSDQQLARVEALKQAQPLVRTPKGPFGAVEPPELNDLVDLAVFILEGKHPMQDHWDRMATGEFIIPEQREGGHDDRDA